MAQSLFTRLKRLFASDVIVRNVGGKKLKVMDVDRLQSMGYKTNYQIDRYARVFHPGSYTYNAQISFQTSRLQLYNDYEVMDADPIIASALDIYSDESTTKNEYGDILQITAEDEHVQEILRNLFYDILNIEFNLWMWIRSMCKYGNFYLKLDISEKFGVVNVVPLPVYEVAREELWDSENPHAVRFIVQGGYGRANFENYEVADFRLLTDSNFLPYGKAMIEAGRKVWKQLTLMEDAMLIHRIMRAPEKRVFKIDIGNIPPNEVDQYMASIIDKMKKTPYIDPQTGDYNLKFNMMNMTEDFYLPVRGGESDTSIDSLSGLEFNAIEDIEYLKNKMMAALKVPKAFLGYEEQIGAKATLAAEDVRFARTIERIQRIVLSELSKIAVIHLYAQGITDERLINFELQLTNPSTIAEQEKLALWETKVRLAGEILAAQDPTLSSDWIYKNIYGLTDADIEEERKLILDDKKRRFRYAQIEAEGNDPVKTGQSFGTAHDLAQLQIGQGEGESELDYGTTNFDPSDPFAVTPGVNIDPKQVDKGGRPPEGAKYKQDSHPRGRNPLGAKDLHGSLDRDNTLKHKYKKSPLHGEGVEPAVSSAKKLEHALRTIPSHWKKAKKTLMESIKTESDEEPNQNEGFLDESNLDLDLSGSKKSE